MKFNRLILASKSPRRKEILERCGFQPEILVSGCDESTVKEKDPARLVEALSKMKAEDVSSKCQYGDLIIAADTVVSIDGRILGKPKTKKEAFEMLSELNGRSHQVYTGVTVIKKKKNTDEKRTFHETAEVTFAKMTNCEIHRYVDSGEPMDKAGAYGIQGIFAKHVERIEGDYYNVMGLPAAATYRVMKEIAK